MDVVTQYAYRRGARIDGNQGQNSLGVFRAFDHQLQREVAVKEILKTDFPDPTAYFGEARAMFRAEHPNVIPVRVAMQTADRICLFMDLFANGSLGTKIKSGPLPLRDAIVTGQQILAGVGAIHASRTIHLDIKPSNILYSDNHQAMIADFGQARVLGPHGVALLPSRMYDAGVPPESFSNGGVGTVLSDVFQVGLTLYRAINGDPLFDSQFVTHAATLEDSIRRGRFPNRNEFLPHVPDRLRRVLRKAMHVDPTKRYPNAIAFANALAKVRVTYNWHATHGADDAITWTAPKPDGKGLQVLLAKSGHKWDVSIHATNNGATRKTRTDRWRKEMTRPEAINHASQLFEFLA